MSRDDDPRDPQDPQDPQDPHAPRDADLPAPRPEAATGDAAQRLATVLLDFVSEVPRSDEPVSPSPAEASRRLTRQACARAAAAAGSLALPPGPLGWLTILPEMLTVWRIQARLVADIAALHGRTHSLTREQMIWCLFRHTASQAVRDLVVRVGERMVVRPMALSALQGVARRIGFHLTERSVARGAARWLPVAGAAGVAAYAWYDTTQVAKSAIALFELPVEVEAPAGAPAADRTPQG